MDVADGSTHEAMTLALATAAGLAIAIVVVASHDRRRRWRQAGPFVGDKRAAPEPALVPATSVYLVYLGWLLVAGGALAALLTLT